MVTTTGGNNPQSLVNATALAIGRGELDVAVLVGADCVYTQAATRRHADRPCCPGPSSRPAPCRPTVFGNDRRGTTDAEEERGSRPAHPRLPPVRERAAGRVRALPGRPPGPHRRRCGPGSPRWRRPTPTPGSARPGPPTADHRGLRGQPDDRLPLHQAPHGQHAGRPRRGAHALLGGAPPGRPASPRTAGSSPWPGRTPTTTGSSPTGSTSTPRRPSGWPGRRPWPWPDTDVDQLGPVDLYSCFPSVVQIAAAELGLPVDDPARPLTVTGGLTFGGGPGNNYGTHAVAADGGGPPVGSGGPGPGHRARAGT